MEHDDQGELGGFAGCCMRRGGEVHGDLLVMETI
jgi:hypothetical protein